MQSMRLQALFERAGFDPFSAIVLETESEELGIEWIDFRMDGIKTSEAIDPDTELRDRILWSANFRYRGVLLTHVAPTLHSAVAEVVDAARRAQESTI